MIDVRKFIAAVPPTATAEEGAQYLEDNPELVARIANRHATTQSRGRLLMKEQRYPLHLIATLLPTTSPGAATWRGFTKPVRDAVEKAVGDVDEKWSIPMASAAADVIVAHYANPSTAAKTLAHLRAILRNKEHGDDVIYATIRPKVSAAHNKRVVGQRLKLKAKSVTPITGEDIEPKDESVTPITGEDVEPKAKSVTPATGEDIEPMDEEPKI